MKIDYAMIATLTPRGLRDVSPLRMMIKTLEMVLMSPVMVRMLGVRARRDLKKYHQQIIDAEAHNFCMRFKAWVKSDAARIAWVRKIIGEANIRKWEIRWYAIHLTRMIQDIAHAEYHRSPAEGRAFLCLIKELLRDPTYICDMSAYNRFMAGYPNDADQESNCQPFEYKPIQWKPFGLVPFGLPAASRPINLAPRVPKSPKMLAALRRRKLRKSRNHRSFTPIAFYPHELRAEARVKEAQVKNKEGEQVETIDVTYVTNSRSAHGKAHEKSLASIPARATCIYSRDGP